MGLKKVIDPCKIGTEYQGFVDQFLLRVSQNFKEEIHSIYICGSIPKGQAKLNMSDADFTIVTNGIISHCLYGEDLGKEVPELIGNSELILNLSSDV